MVSLESKLKEWCNAFLEGSDEFLVEIENKAGSTKYRVIVDGLEAITIKRCAMISRYLSKQIEEDEAIDEDDFFTLEVSSPGADKPLKLPKQFFKHIGRSLLVNTIEENEFSGKLISVDEKIINLEIVVSKSEKKIETIEFIKIKEANVIIAFK